MSRRRRKFNQGIAKRSAASAKGLNVKDANECSFPLSRRECVGTLPNGSTTLAIGLNKFAINPGNPSLFPWLTGVARNFESYRFTRMRFTLVPKVSTDTAGRLVMVIDYDPSDETPNTELTLMNSEGCVSGPVWDSLVLDYSVNAGQTRKRHFTRDHDIFSGELRQYDVGNLYVWVDSDATDLPTLFVEYSVVFYTPQLVDFVGGQFACDWTGASETEQLYQPWGYDVEDIPFIEGSDETVLEVTDPDSFLLKKRGKYLLLRFLEAATSVSAIGAITTSAPNATQGWTNTLISAAGDEGLNIYEVDVEDPDVAFNIANDTITGAFEASRMLVLPIATALAVACGQFFK